MNPITKESQRGSHIKLGSGRRHEDVVRSLLQPFAAKLKDLLMAFVGSVSTKGNIDAERIAERYDIIAQEGLGPEEARKFVDSAFRDRAVSMRGVGVTKILLPVSRYFSDSGHSEKKQHILVLLGAFFKFSFGPNAGGK